MEIALTHTFIGLTQTHSSLLNWLGLVGGVLVFGAPASRRVAQVEKLGRGLVDSCLSAWPRSGSREFESMLFSWARRGEQHRGVAQRATDERGALSLWLHFFWASKRKLD